MFISMLTSALTCAARPGPPTNRSEALIDSSIGRTRAKASSSPPQIRYSVPSRACGIELAMQASIARAPAARASAATST